MGNCMTRLKAEMAPPPPRSGNWDMMGPQRPDPYVAKKVQSLPQTSGSGNGSALERKETPSGIPGLTYDHAGRPVWREENATPRRDEGIEIEHRESRH